MQDLLPNDADYSHILLVAIRRGDNILPNLNFVLSRIFRIGPQVMNLEFSFEGDALIAFLFAQGSDKLGTMSISSFRCRRAVQLCLFIIKKKFIKSMDLLDDLVQVGRKECHNLIEVGQVVNIDQLHELGTW
mmetsp:Transcript_131163/g.379416  ORF Transcript_131163/g.379416 Transcript_131163/m.379416 type:complete len:132 (-) Transcript_131163:87-482(-)